MIPQTLKDKWQQDLNEAVASIETYTKPVEWDIDHHYKIFEWLLASDRMMIYGILPDDNKMGTVFAIDALFNALCHALYDDGDVSFLTLWRDNEPIEHKIEFVFRGDVNESDTHYFQNTMGIQQRHDTFMCDHLNKPRPIYTVSAHRDPIKFMKDVETLHERREQTRIKNDERRKKYLAQFYNNSEK